MCIFPKELIFLTTGSNLLIFANVAESYFDCLRKQSRDDDFGAVFTSDNRDILKLAQDELDTEVGKTRWIQESDIINLPYLQVIVKETICLPTRSLIRPTGKHEDRHNGDYFISKSHV